jgi:hypothetical protein
VKPSECPASIWLLGCKPGALDAQKARGWKGRIVTNPNCSTVVLSMALAPLRQFGLNKVSITTLQAISGAGYPGVASWDILGNVIPFIDGEEHKIVRPLFGTLLLWGLRHGLSYLTLREGIAFPPSASPWALRNVLGEHIEQKGSLVDPEKTRFDFAHHEPLTAEQIAEIEQLVERHVLGDGAPQELAKQKHSLRADDVPRILEQVAPLQRPVIHKFRPLQQRVHGLLPLLRVGIRDECPNFLGLGLNADEIEIDAAEELFICGQR